MYASALGTYSLARVKGNLRYKLDEQGRCLDDTYFHAVGLGKPCSL